ncbi:MAG: peptide chain release factor 1 [Pseudomonadota bacterium]
MIPDHRIDQIFERFAFLEAKMAEGADGETMVALAREYADLRPVVERAETYRRLRTEIADAEALASDPELGELASEELPGLKTAFEAAETELGVALLPRDAADARPAILEIRPGTGGEEAALFAADLLRMYQRFAERSGWRMDLVEAQTTELGGLKEAVANIAGEGVFARLKFESGVHRVQRVPTTESGGRIHTSAATVAVLPEAEEIDVEIAPSDIRIDTMRASGAGGQHVNTTDSAVRITHLPTGIVVTSSEKSQHANRAKAMAVLRARLYDQERQAAAAARASERRDQIGSGDRSERIRTYNFPQGRVTDHRIGLTLYRLDEVMDGDLEEVVSALLTADQAERLANLDEG